MKKYWKYLLLALPMLLTLTACEEEYTPNQLEESILMRAVELQLSLDQQNKLYIDNTEMQAYPMLKGETERFDFTTTPDPSEVTYPTVYWSSSNTDVVSVAEDGTLTAVGAGYAIITIRPDTPNEVAEASMKIVVSDELVPATAITITDKATMKDPINGDTPACYMGETMQLTAAIEPDNTTYKTVKWSSKDETIATVDQITGLVTGVTRGFVDIVATALDPENPVSATHHIYIDQVVDPLGIKILNAPAENYEFAILERTFVVDYTTYPTLSTKSLIEWKSSDPSIATVSGGVVTFQGFGSVTITAICKEGEIPSDQADFAREASFKLNIPEGLVRETFTNPLNVTWKLNPSHVSQGGSTQIQTAENGDNYIEVSCYLGGTKFRGDFQTAIAHTIHAGQYPIFAFRMDRPQDFTATVGNLTFDAAGGSAQNTGTSFSGSIPSNNNKWVKRYLYSDNSSVLVYNFAEQGPGGKLLPTDEAVKFNTMQMKYADVVIPQPENGFKYRVFWIQTFKSMDELIAKMNEDCAQYGYTYEAK